MTSSEGQQTTSARDHRLWLTRRANCDVSQILPVKDIVLEKMKSTMRSPVFVFEVQRAVLLDDALSFDHFRSDRALATEVAATRHTLPVFLEFVARCYSRLSKDFQARVDGLEALAQDEEAGDDERSSAVSLLTEFRESYYAGRILYCFVETAMDVNGGVYAYRTWLLNRFVMVDTNAVWSQMLRDSDANSHEQAYTSGGRSDQWRQNLADRTTFSECVDVLNGGSREEESRVTLDALSNPHSPAHPNQCFSAPSLEPRPSWGEGGPVQKSQRISHYFGDQWTTFDPPQARFFYQVDASEVQTSLEVKMLPHVQAEMALADTVLWMFMSNKIAAEEEAEEEGDDDRRCAHSDDDDDDDDLHEAVLRGFFSHWGRDPGPSRKKQKTRGAARDREVRLHFVNGGDYVTQSLAAVNPYKPLECQGKALLANVREFDNALMPDTEDEHQTLTRWLYLLCRRRMHRLYCVYARHADNTVMSRPMAAVHTARTQQDLYARANVFALQHNDPTMPLFCNWEGKRLVELYVAFQSCSPCLLDLLLKYRLDAFCVDDKRVHQHLMQQSHHGGTGKSFLLKICGVWCSIPGTAFTLAYNSDKCFADSSRNQNDMVFCTHECKEDTLFNPNSPAHSLLKILLSENTQSHIVLEMDPPPRETKMSHVPMICCWFGCRNEVIGNPKVMSDALSSRFDMRYSKERPGDMRRLINLFLKDVRAGSTQQQQVKDETAKRYQALQGIVAELEKCIGSAALCDVSTHLAGVFFQFVTDKLHAGTQNVRLFERAITHSRCNALLDAIAKTWMYEGAPLFGQDINLEAGLPFLERFLYVGVEHCISAFGDLLPLFFDSATMAFAKAIPVLERDDRYLDVKVNLNGIAFPKKNYYVFFYTKKEMKETLLDIIVNHTGRASASVITGQHFDALGQADLWIDAPAFIGMDERGGTTRIPLLYSYTVPGNGDLHKRTRNQTGEIHGIAIHFAKLWARDPELVADEIVRDFLHHKHQPPRKYTFRPHETTVYIKTTIGGDEADESAPVFKLPRESIVQHSMLGILPESAHLLTKAMTSDLCPDSEIRMPYDTWALLLHNKALHIGPGTRIPRDAVQTTKFTEHAFSELREAIKRRASDDDDDDDDDDEPALFFAGQDLSHYLDTVKASRPVWQYKLLYNAVTDWVSRAAKATSAIDCHDFPTQLLLDDTSQRYVWQEKEFKSMQRAIASVDQIEPLSVGYPQFYIVDKTASQTLETAVRESNAACMRIYYPHSTIYPAILQVRRCHRFVDELPDKTYPEEWMSLETESADSVTQALGAQLASDLHQDDLPLFTF